MGVTGIALGIGIGPFDNGGGGGGFAPQGASLTLTGGDATLLAPLIVDGASLSLSGGAVNFARDLGAAGNSLTLSGGAATLSGGSALSVITSSNGAWWVVAERDGSDNLVDQTGGGRDLLLPGGSANPVLLDHTGTDYFWFPGTASNSLTVPDSTVFDFGGVTGTVDFRWHGRLSDYTPATFQPLIARTDGGLCFIFRVNTDGTLFFFGGGANNSSTAATGWTDGEDAWFRAVADKDNDELKFYTSSNGTDWTQLGATVSVSIGAFNNTSSPVYIGQYSTNYGSAHRFYRGIIIESGTTVLDTNASSADPDATTFTEASSNAATVTINRSSTGYCTEVVDQPGYAFATDDYLYATDDALFDVGASDEFTAGLVVRVHGTPGSDYALITKKNTTSGTDAGWSLQENTAGKLDARVADGTASPDKVTASAVTDHVLIAASIVRDATTVGAYDPTAGSIETASDTTTGTLANAQQLRIGADGGGADFLRGFVVGGFFLKDTARTAAQIDGLSDALITANGGTP